MNAKNVPAKGSILEKIFVIAFVVILVLLPFHAFFSTWGGTLFGSLLLWKSWKEIILLLLIPLVLWYCILRPDVAEKLWRSWLNRLIAAYVVLHLIFAITSQASIEAIGAGLLMNLRFLAMFILAQIVLTVDHHWLKPIKHALPLWLLFTTIALALMAITQVTLLPPDFLAAFGYDKNTTIAPYVVVDQHPDALRAFATMRGPNTFGAYLLLPLAVALVLVVWQRRNILAGLALGLGGAALLFTSSRSAWLGTIVMVVVLAIIIVPRQRLIKIAKWGAIPGLLAIVGFFWIATTIPSVRLAVFHSRADRTTLTEGSSDKHWQETLNGVQDAAATPLGQGVGTAGPASFYNTKSDPEVAENYFVQIAQEVGIVGLALFIAINAMVAYQLWQRRQHMWPRVLLASFAGLTVVNFFLHGWADDPTSMTWWGIAGLYLFADSKK